MRDLCDNFGTRQATVIPQCEATEHGGFDVNLSALIATAVWQDAHAALRIELNPSTDLSLTTTTNLDFDVVASQWAIFEAVPLQREQCILVANVDFSMHT